MIIDESKVNLLEKDIEEYLFQNPDSIETNWGPVIRWVKRQFQVPSGIIDLLGLTRGGAFALVEIKNTAIDANALTQICRYEHDLTTVLNIMELNIMDVDVYFPSVLKIVVGKSIDTKTMREAEALNISVHSFAVELSLSLSKTTWTEQFKEAREATYMAMTEDTDFVSIMNEYNKATIEYKKRMDEQRCESNDTQSSETIQIPF